KQDIGARLNAASLRRGQERHNVVRV
ncbi:MAG: hypothetical protein JWM17_2093, partial [Actinobacteria bacterium]|nr:hypothetical protein [Actinomycetota bacterium]